MLCSVYLVVTDVLGQPISLIFKGHAVLDLRPSTLDPHRRRLPRNVDNTQPIILVRQSFRFQNYYNCISKLFKRIKNWSYHSVYSKHRATIYLFTPWCRVLLEKPNGLQLVKKFPAFHGTRRFITALTSVRHLSLSRASPHPTSWRSILILSTHLRPSGLFPSGFPTKTLYTPPLLTHTCHMPSPSHCSPFYHPHDIG